MVNTPIPQNLKSETKKAAKILREFTMPNSKTGPDKLIPAGILAKAKGLAIITVFKAGFLVTARGGSGIVIAKLDDDSFDYATGWSAPSAIGLAGLGGGFEIGVEVTDFVIILNSRAAINAFSKGGNLTLGGNFTVAAGPLGRNVEGDVSVRSPAAIYTYSKTKGIFAGISIEGSALIERKEANKKFYGRDLRATQILCGEVDPPEECDSLYAVMREHQDLAAEAALRLAKRQAQKHAGRIKDAAQGEAVRRGFLSGFIANSRKSSSGKIKSSSRSKSEWTLSRSYKDDDEEEEKEKPKKSQTQHQPLFIASARPGTAARSDKKSVRSSKSTVDLSAASARPGTAARSDKKSVRSSKSTVDLSAATSSDPWEDDINFNFTSSSRVASRPSRPTWVVADYTFEGQLTCDLPFRAGDKLKVTTATDNLFDWWEGLDERGRQGIFPANFVHSVS
ncbi:SH3 domain-containing YSC84-like protein 1 [Elysia marginata]|uniref:SH3 domain-containing YSC84-like protein 1 n=1 Tax=Elysia marginata TaxID=1093978 RepID=A0AAV4JRF5_9GAST|nr:SH3 domain-containing YSC84-like protein 1 [Elysia marginata]